MLRKHVAACLAATALMATPALAQTSTAPSGQSTSQGQTASSSSHGGTGQFVSQMSADQFRSSKLVGLGVYGPNNERIGDINEVIVDQQGKVDAIVIGVGGFLGIGEKDVAVPFKSVEWVRDTVTGPAANRPTTGTTGNTATGTAGTAGSTAGGPAPVTGGPNPAGGTTMSSTGSTGTAGASAGGNAMTRGYPDHAIVRMTKADLQNAPAFHYPR